MIVPSFTSSSNISTDLVQNSSHGRTPAGNWRGTLIVFILCFVVFMGGLEFFWRMQGHKPEINDSQKLWAQQRSLIERHAKNPDTVALIGASRIQLGFDTFYFREHYPDRPLINLAIDGTTPAAVLKDLADDENFNGTVLASMEAPGFNREEWGQSQPHVSRYHNDYKNNLDRQFNTRISLWLQQRIVLLQHTLGIRNLIKTVSARQLPEPFYITTYPDRSRAADYSKMPDVKKHRQERIDRVRAIDAVKPPAEFETWKTDVMEIAQWVKAIQDRGGRVVIIFFPTSGEHWEIDEKRYPRAQYWDKIHDLTGADTFHFQDIPGMRDFDLPDTSHLDQKDREAFTALLLKHVLPATPHQ